MQRRENHSSKSSQLSNNLISRAPADSSPSISRLANQFAGALRHVLLLAQRQGARRVVVKDRTDAAVRVDQIEQLLRGKLADTTEQRRL